MPSMRVPSRRVLGRAIKAIQGRTIKVPSRQFRLPFAVGGAGLSVGRICLLHSQQASQVWIRSMLCRQISLDSFHALQEGQIWVRSCLVGR